MAKRRKTNIRGRQLTAKQVALALTLVKDEPNSEVAPRENLAQTGHQVPVPVRSKVPELMDTYGLSDESLIKKRLLPLLSATRSKYFQVEGGMRQRREVADNSVRTRALDMAFKLNGSYVATGSKVAEPASVQVIVVDIPRPARPVVEAPSDIAIDKKKAQPADGQRSAGNHPLIAWHDRQVTETLGAASHASIWGSEPRFVLRRWLAK